MRHKPVQPATALIAEWDNVVAAARKVPPGHAHGAAPLDECEHFYRCAHCGQAVDMRQLGDVLYHDKPGHPPLPAARGGRHDRR